MEKIVRTELVEKEVCVYKAFDGKEFKSLNDCNNYERTIKESLFEGIEQCKEAKNYPPFNGGENMEFHEYYWFRPKSIDEIYSLNKAFNFNGFDLDDRYIGKWICIEDVDFEDAWFSCLDNDIDYVSELLNKLGYSLAIFK